MYLKGVRYTKYQFIIRSQWNLIRNQLPNKISERAPHIWKLNYILLHKPWNRRKMKGNLESILIWTKTEMQILVSALTCEELGRCHLHPYNRKSWTNSISMTFLGLITDLRLKDELPPPTVGRKANPKSHSWDIHTWSRSRRSRKLVGTLKG